MEFSTLDIVKLLGIKRGRIREWIDQEYIKPSVQKSTIQGNKNIFNRWDLAGILMFDELLYIGVQRQKAREFFYQWQELTASMKESEWHEIESIVGFNHSNDEEENHSSDIDALRNKNEKVITGPTFWISIVKRKNTKKYPKFSRLHAFTYDGIDDFVHDLSTNSKSVVIVNMKEVIAKIDSLTR